MASKTVTDPAARLADRLNYLPIAVFGLWLAPIIHLWLQAFAPVEAFRPSGWTPPSLSPLPWFAAGLAAGLTALATPGCWYRPRAFEAGLYRRLGVRAFRRLATNGDVIVRAARRRYPGYTIHSGDLDQALKNTIIGEKSHAALFLFGAVTSAYAVAVGWEAWAIWSIVTNIIGNLYPVLLQRYTRGRLARMGVGLGSAQ